MSLPRPGVYISPEGKKTLIPLENNPQVFTDLIHRLGLDPDLTFYDIWSVDEPALLNHVPRPVHALIFIAPADVYHRVRANDKGSRELTYDGSGPDEPVIWFKQTIGHTCGLLALMHSVCNGPAKQFLKPGSLLDELLEQCIPLKPLPRAQVLYNSQALEDAHLASAAKGDTAPPSSKEPNGYHFISFVRSSKDGHLYELEGGWNGPIDRGAVDESKDMLSEEAISLGIQRYLEAAQGNLEFSIVALTTRPKKG